MQNVSEHSDSDWLAPAEASLKLGVSTKTLTRMANEGQLTMRRLPSGHRRYLRQSVDAQASVEEQAS